MKDIPLPRCQGQACYMENRQSEPVKVSSHTLRPGERACLGCRRPVKFSRRDPRRTVPDWCPHQLSRPKWTLYGYSDYYQITYENHYRGDKLLDRPIERWYQVLAEGDTCLCARDFWREHRENGCSVKLLLDVSIKAGQMLIIDDGVTPRAFYQSDTKLSLTDCRPECFVAVKKG